MLKLSNQSFKTINKKLKEIARPLDIAHFNYHFQQGDKQALITEIKKFQNKDGGFGNALEPDFRLPLSTPMATSIGLRLLKMVDNSQSAQKIIKKAITYLEESYNKDRNGWYAVRKEVNDYPHTPWWHFDKEEQMTVIDKSWGNPSAELLAYLLRYRDYVKQIDLNSLVKQAVKNIQHKKEHESENEIYCYLKLYEEADTKTKSPLKGSIAEGIKQMIEYDQEKWQEYVPLPLDFVPSPEQERFGVSESKIKSNLDFYVELIEANKESLIKPPWGANFYKEGLKDAYQEWQGKLTLDILIRLDNYGRIER
ncbi:hypothetical protein C8C77_103210 [Halanaerobium saccharolyticum]|uniref:Prenyltransferase/squalene oxidase-like repeat protein n=1 Tax=Halanaerobium saccharolyticum TaxID=43595 RepID=A0A4R7Z6T5_9FIRM|nr:hypothetical protein [Halanaerobium saccharolyticum]RAK11222.1 hypothetical protein C7958_103210 [Halanaerobium saccharolyticum]TDW07073.1 hypothetical protein C8C77_103210 [Halanaerobium saccharolyticum]TDX63838.1 hypothetical protein C7956_102210 [Halanaerobium saccharolyticum]